MAERATLGSLNIEALAYVDEGDGKRLWHQKRCYHCGEAFLSLKSNALGCSRVHAQIAGRFIKRNGAPKIPYNFRKPKDAVNMELKKYEY